MASKKTCMVAKIYLWCSTREPSTFEFLNTNVDFVIKIVFCKFYVSYLMRYNLRTFLNSNGLNLISIYLQLKVTSSLKIHPETVIMNILSKNTVALQ